MFTLEQKPYDTILLLEYTGDMKFAEAVELRNELEKLFRRPHVKLIVLSLENVASVDSSGLGALVAAHTMARTLGKKLMLYQPDKKVTALLEQIHIDDFFPMLEDKDDLLWRITGGTEPFRQQAG